MQMVLNRRKAIAALASVSALSLCKLAEAAESPPQIRVTRDPTCGCCGAWVDHLRAANFTVDVVEVPDVNRTKAKLGVPHDLMSCHTAEIGGYVVEGHVPASTIQRLLSEKPDAKGLAVPGMPIGSPGMMVEGLPNEEYAVVLFGAFGRRNYARFHGLCEL